MTAPSDRLPDEPQPPRLDPWAELRAPQDVQAALNDLIERLDQAFVTLHAIGRHRTLEGNFKGADRLWAKSHGVALAKGYAMEALRG